MNYTASQKLAIKEIGKNILVSAGAGSGKTGVLKARVIEKLKQGIHIDELIILTFTKAAAFEMKTRIIEAINEDIKLKPELKRIDNAIISTFDAMCLKLVSEYHYLLDLPSNVMIGDKIQILNMEKTVLETVIKNYYISNDDSFNELVIKLFQKGDGIIYDIVSSLAKKISKEPSYLQTLDNFESTYLSETVLNNHYEDFSKELFLSRDYAYKKYLNLINALNSYNQDKIVVFKNTLNVIFDKLNQFVDIETMYSYLNSIVLPRKPSIRGDDDFKAIMDEFYPTIKNTLNEILDVLTDLQGSNKTELVNSVLETKDRVLKIVEITRTYLVALDKRKREDNLYSYPDIMEYATKLLENNPNICSTYKLKINEIMVDEYQDTNDLQEYFISLISNNNLFMVGDIKQSIYGFRDANPKNFLKKYHEFSKGINGLAIDLRENFRSRNEVLEDINKTFENVMNDEIGGINYKDNQSLIYGLKEYNKSYPSQHYGVEVIKYDFETEKTEAETLNITTLEATLLAKDIVSRINQKYQILDIATNEFRNINYSDIAILVDRKTGFPEFSKILSKFNIPVNLYSDEPFVDSPEMLFLTNYLRFNKCFIDAEYLRKNFRRVFYSVARSFVFKISDEVIIDFLVKENVTCLKDLNKLNQYPELKKIFDLTYKIRNQINKMSTYDLIVLIYQELEIFKAISYLDNPRKKEEKLDYFAANINSFSNFNFDDLIDYLETIEENKGWDIEYSEAKTSIDAVKLMTMHKSKGLQFPVVYCPGLYKKFNFSETKDFFSFDKTYGLITSAFNTGFYYTFLRKLSLDKSRREYISERIRLLYVAFTRAKENLILFTDYKNIRDNYNVVDKNGYIETKIRTKYGSFTDLLSSTEVINYDYFNQIESDVNPAESTFSPTDGKVIKHKNFNYIKTEVEDIKYSKSTLKLFSDRIINSIEYGESIHKLLEQVDFENIEVSISKFPNKVKHSFETLLNSVIFRGRTNPKVFQEYEFYETKQAITNHGIIDLLVIYDDIVYIIDYKLKNISDLAYYNQLKGYKDFISSKTNKPVKTYLYSILSEEIQEVV
ncbi:UvrD-helicase domain-containing protein [Mycoplasmatota bacterium WC30]